MSSDFLSEVFDPRFEAIFSIYQANDCKIHLPLSSLETAKSFSISTLTDNEKLINRKEEENIYQEIIIQAANEQSNKDDGIIHNYDVDNIVTEKKQNKKEDLTSFKVNEDNFIQKAISLPNLNEQIKNLDKSKNTSDVIYQNNVHNVKRKSECTQTTLPNSIENVDCSSEGDETITTKLCTKLQNLNEKGQFTSDTPILQENIL